MCRHTQLGQLAENKEKNEQGKWVLPMSGMVPIFLSREKGED